VIPTDLANVKLLASTAFIAPNKTYDQLVSVQSASPFLRSFTLAPLTSKGPSIGVLPLAGSLVSSDLNM